MKIGDSEARRFWTRLLAHWISALKYVHSRRTHEQILGSLEDPGVRWVYEQLDLVMPWHTFVGQVHVMSRQSQQRGLVRPDGAPRPAARGRAGRPRKRAQGETPATRINVPVRRDRSDPHTTKEGARRTDSGSGGMSWQG